MQLYKKTCAKGLTAAEVVVAIGVLAMMLVTTLLLFTQLAASTTKNNLVNMGSLLADRVLENAIDSADPDPAASAFYPTTWTGEDSAVSHGEERVTKFAYTVAATPLSPSPRPGERWLLEVEVHWWHDDPTVVSTRSGYGRLSTKQRRVVYIQR